MQSITKKEGFVEYAVAIMVMFIMGITLKFSLNQREMRLVDEILEDALTSAVLASAVVDLDEYGTSGSIVIDTYHGQFSTEAGEPVNGLYVAYNNFLDSLKANLGNSITGDTPIGIGGTQIVQDIRVQEFSVYNMWKDGTIYMFSVAEELLDTNKKIPNIEVLNDLKELGSKVDVPVTPDGEPIIGTTVYVKIEYDLYNYDGERLTDGIINGDGEPVSGSRDFKVSIYEAEE